MVAFSLIALLDLKSNADLLEVLYRHQIRTFVFYHSEEKCGQI